MALGKSVHTPFGALSAIICCLVN